MKNIPTAIAAIKAGGINYFANLAEDEEDLETALLTGLGEEACLPEDPMSVERTKWKHIHRLLKSYDRNVSGTARR
jgi:ActR/RegA family two-component response regulator|tara:strand:- start:571 stop:798 length:228 start_codon:yes stop_codon:yes gene_type:complete